MTRETTPFDRKDQLALVVLAVLLLYVFPHYLDGFRLNLVGKYLSYAFVVQEEAKSFGESIGLVSGDMFSFFREDLDIVFGWFDLLWAGLAVFTAWRIPQVDEPEPTAEGLTPT